MKANRLIIFEAGNTHLKIGLFQNQKLLAFRRFAIDHDLPPGDWMPSSWQNPPLPKAVGIFTRKKARDAILSWFSSREIDCTEIVRSAVPIRTDPCYKGLKTLGMDRLVMIHALQTRGFHSLALLDFGTATTVQVLDPNGLFCGGWILPSLYSLKRGLEETATELPRLSIEQVLSYPTMGLGVDTNSSIALGLRYGFDALIKGLVANIRQQIPSLRVLTTGFGYRPTLPKSLYRPHLLIHAIFQLAQSFHPIKKA